MECKLKFTGYKPATVTLYSPSHAVILKEPSLIAVDSRTEAVTAVGGDVQSAPGQNGAVVVGSPLKQGVVADFGLARTMLRHFLKKAKLAWFFRRPLAALFVPVDMTPIEHKVYTELFLCIGAKRVQIFEDTFFGALGDRPSSYQMIVEIIPG